MVKVGVVVVYCYVCDLEIGVLSCDLVLYCELIDCVCDSDIDVVLNLIVGMGGDIVFGDIENLFFVNVVVIDMIGVIECVVYVVECLLEICMLDCGIMNFVEVDYVMINMSGMLCVMG